LFRVHKALKYFTTFHLYGDKILWPTLDTKKERK